MQVLVTGSAGFIGFHLTKTLCQQGVTIHGIDSLNHYYDIRLKYARLKECGIQNPEEKTGSVSTLYPHYQFSPINLCDKTALESLFQNNSFDCIVHLAAQAGVRYSLTHPDSYIENNIQGFLNLLEMCRKYNQKRLIYASSSSIYGNCQEVPFREDFKTDQPVSLYAASKKSNELMAYSYSALFGIQTIGLRFFTVYGPWGRPDMAPFLFAKAILDHKPIQIFNNGNLSRDFTYVDDIVQGICQIIHEPTLKRQDFPPIPAAVYNIGHGSPIQLMDFIQLLEQYLGETAQKEFLDMQPGDVYQTWADTSKLQADYGYTPHTSLEKGIPTFATWFKEYNQMNPELD